LEQLRFTQGELLMGRVADRGSVARWSSWDSHRGS